MVFVMLIAICLFTHCTFLCTVATIAGNKGTECMNDSSILNEDIQTPSSSHQRRQLTLEFDDNPTSLPTAPAAASASGGYKHWVSDSQDSSQFIFIAIPKIVKETKDKCNPLPDPFPLPKHFRPDVHVSLMSQRMTKNTRAAFFSAVASAMFQFKRYPSRDDYVSVARQVVSKYPFFGSKRFGATHVSHNLHSSRL